MQALIEHLVIGTAIGAVYSIIALGFVLIYKGTGIFNLAQGSLMIIGAYLCFLFSATIGLPFWAACVITLIFSFFIGWLIEYVFLQKLIGESHLSLLIVTIGIYVIVRGIILLIGGTANRSFPEYIPNTPVVILGANIQPVFLLATAAAIVLFTIFILFFRFTSIGIAMRATQDNQHVAQSLGISAQRVYALSWAISSLAAAVGGIIIGTMLSVSFSLDDYGLKVMPAIILGGLESIPGALIGGIAMGIIEHLSGAYLGTYLIGIEDTANFVVLFLILLIRPYGIFGQKTIARA
ncbi:MAG: branched-chain amino acid ABC transporter permease [Dehalococcoidia bacterium]|jgi:branched-chain amino acid transport system permease protein